MEILAVAVLIASIVCWIMVLIKMFQSNVLYGILRIICGIWAFIWGWMNVEKAGLKKVMLVWTAAWIISLILNFALGATLFEFEVQTS